jgi:hypothetical protein
VRQIDVNWRTPGDVEVTMEKHRPARGEKTYGVQAVWMAIMFLSLFGAVNVQNWMVQLILCLGVVISVSGLAGVMFAAWTPLLNDLNNHMLESRRGGPRT